MGLSWPLFAFLSFFHQISSINWKNVDVVVRNRTWGRRMVGAYGSSELRLPPFQCKDSLMPSQERHIFHLMFPFQTRLSRSNVASQGSIFGGAWMTWKQQHAINKSTHYGQCCKLFWNEIYVFQNRRKFTLMPLGKVAQNCKAQGQPP